MTPGARTETVRNEVPAYVSIGSNLGDKAANCRSAIEALSRDDGCRLLARSPLYRTEPVDYAEQDWFVNGVVQVATGLKPESLLELLLHIERQAGRVRGALRYGPRVLDLDLILYGDRVIALPNLVVPHPRMHKRRFVLQPICDINKHLIHPVLGLTMSRLLEDLGPDGQQVVALTCDC